MSCSGRVQYFSQLRRAWPNSTLRRRLATNATGYLQSQLECANLWYVSDLTSSFFWLSPCHGGMLCHNATVKPFLVSLVKPVAYLKSELI